MSERRFPKAYPYISEDKTMDTFECPDCGFEYNARHEMDDDEGGYKCVSCAEANLQAEIHTLRSALEKIVDGEVDSLGDAFRIAQEAISNTEGAVK